MSELQRPSSMASSELQSCVEALRIQLEEERKRRKLVVGQIHRLAKETQEEEDERSSSSRNHRGEGGPPSMTSMLPQIDGVRAQSSSTASLRSGRSLQACSQRSSVRAPTPPTLNALKQAPAKSTSEQLDAYLRSLPTDLGGEAPPVPANVRRGGPFVNVPKPPNQVRAERNKQRNEAKAEVARMEGEGGVTAAASHYQKKAFDDASIPGQSTATAEEGKISTVDPRILEQKQKLDAAVRRHHSPIGIRVGDSPSREVARDVQNAYRTLCQNAKALKKPPLPSAAKGIKSAGAAKGGNKQAYTFTGHRKATAAEVYMFQKRHDERMAKVHAFNFLE